MCIMTKTKLARTITLICCGNRKHLKQKLSVLRENDVSCVFCMRIFLFRDLIEPNCLSKTGTK